MADALLSAALERLIALIEEQARYHVNLVIVAKEEVLNLSEELWSLTNVLDDAENRRFQDKNINHWLSRLEQTAYEMEDVLDEWNYALLKLMIGGRKRKVCSFIPSSSCLCFKKVVVRHEIGRKIVNVKAQLNTILKEKDRYGFVISQPKSDDLPHSWRETTSLIDVGEIHGRKRDEEILVEKVMGNGGSQEESGIQIVSIVGVGGLGKTTLAQLVYNHSQVEKSFDLRIWICVSDPFDPTVIAKGILESIENNSSPNTNQLDVLLTKVRESTKEKRFLLVLDDVWTEDYNKWGRLKNSLRFGRGGSKILVTTRNERVVKMMGSRESEMCRPGVLSDEDCWLLLCRTAHFERNEVKFEQIGKKIAKKCNGLPLAAKTLGSLLRFKSSLDEWENVLNSEIWNMEEAEVDIFPHLLLSYNELSPTLKRCFSYCSVFPKDTNIDVKKLIENWMALGYLGSNIHEMELKGKECFDVLAMRSLFQNFEIDESGMYQACKMHDIIHDFAQFVRKSGRVEGARMNKTTCQACDPSVVSNVNRFCSLDLDRKETPLRLCDCLTRLRVLSMRGCLTRSFPQGMEILIHLRQLDLSENKLSQENLKIIFQFYCLQFLRLSACNLEEIPKEIGNLINLRLLDLSWNAALKELPKEIGNLIRLRHLHFEYNMFLMVLPESICNLQELQTLYIEGCTSLIRIPEGLGTLTGLREVDEFRGGSGRSKFGLLKKLNNLSGMVRLVIKLGDNDREEVVEDVRNAELRSKIHIESLVIRFEDRMDEEVECNNMVWMNMIDALEPHRNLQHLYIFYYKGAKFPVSWMVSPFNQLKRICLRKCNHLSSLPPLGRLPCLEEIVFEALGGLEIVGRELLGIQDVESSSNALIAFPKLKALRFYYCRKWKEWEDITAEEEQHSTIMPCLTELLFFYCPAMTKLPRYLLSKAWPLEKLQISDSAELQQHCRDNGVVFEFVLWFRDCPEWKEWEDITAEEECNNMVWMNMIDALEPHQNLQHLYSWNYEGAKFPVSWMVSPFNQLKSIVLWTCNHLSSLPSLGRLPCLEDIEFHELEGLEIVGRELLGIQDVESSSNALIAFPKLKRLIFYDCLKLKECEDITAEEEQHSTIMPCLTELFFNNCPALTKLPRYLLRKAWPLEKLVISDSAELQQHCRDNGVAFDDPYPS